MRKIVQTVLLVTLLAAGLCLVPPASAETTEIGFVHTVREDLDIKFEFYFDVTTREPALLFGGTEQFYIDLQPSHTTLTINMVMNNVIISWEDTYSEAPVGEETFRIETSELVAQGVEAFLITVDGSPYVSYRDDDKLSASGKLQWHSAGEKSFAVTAPMGMGDGEILASWYFEWKVRYGLDFVGTGELFTDWTEMDELKSSVNQAYHLYFGFGYLFVGLGFVVAILVVLVIRRRRKLKPELKPEPEP